MSKQKFYPLTDLERFDLLQAMFPGELSDDDAGWDQMDELVTNKFDIDPEDFDRLVGRLVMCAPVMTSPISGTQHHALGSVTVSDGQVLMTAAVKREIHIPQEPAPEKVSEDCDHDWEDMGDGTMACTYPECNATRPKGQRDLEPTQ